MRTRALIFSIKAVETHGAALRNSFLSAAHQAEPTSVAKNIQREREREKMIKAEGSTNQSAEQKNPASGQLIFLRAFRGHNEENSR